MSSVVIFTFAAILIPIVIGYFVIKVVLEDIVEGGEVPKVQEEDRILDVSKAQLREEKSEAPKVEKPRAEVKEQSKAKNRGRGRPPRMK